MNIETAKRVEKKITEYVGARIRECNDYRIRAYDDGNKTRENYWDGARNEAIHIRSKIQSLIKEAGIGTLNT